MINSGTQLDKHKVPYAIYMDYVGQNEMAQLDNVLKADGVVQMAVMPDCHAGYVSPVGCVLKTDGIVYPAVVGYDIGCGMRTEMIQNLSVEDIRSRAAEIRDYLAASLNIGIGRSARKLHKNAEYDKAFGEYSIDVGSLGGGNHFLEIGYDEEEGRVFITVHTGSRGYGHKIGTKHMKVAADIHKSMVAEAMHGLSAKDHPEEFQAYLVDYSSAIEFAYANREVIMSNAIACLSTLFKKDVKAEKVGECLHNMLQVNHYGTYYLHRKGATVAGPSNIVIIPGNMRDGIVIGEGLSNSAGLYSCSHGAGRILSRSQAKTQISMEQFTESMKDVPGAMVGKKTIDEAPDAYKNIDEVMANQRDLVRELFRIKPLVNIKG